MASSALSPPKSSFVLFQAFSSQPEVLTHALATHPQKDAQPCLRAAIVSTHPMHRPLVTFSQINRTPPQTLAKKAPIPPRPVAHVSRIAATPVSHHTLSVSQRILAARPISPADRASAIPPKAYTASSYNPANASPSHVRA